MIIYKATFPNGKSYIGKTTKTLEERIKQHKSDSKRHKNYAFYNAMNKYGFDCIQWEIIDDTAKNEAELSQKEIYWIKYYNTYIHANNSNGYNTTLGGEGVSGLKYSEEAKKNLSKIRQGEGNSFYGKHHTNKAKEKMSKSKIGKYNGENNPNYGNKWSDEQKKKISTINKGRLSGENNPSAIIDECLARKIKTDLYNNVSIKDICDKYKVSRNIVANIKYLKTWEELLPELNNKISDSIKHVSKIDIELVKEIKTELASGRKPIDIINEYDVTRDTVYNIKSLRGYKNILPELNSILKTLKD